MFVFENLISAVEVRKRAEKTSIKVLCGSFHAVRHNDRRIVLTARYNLFRIKSGPMGILREGSLAKCIYPSRSMSAVVRK